jgi:hypothetical protein
MGIGVFKARDDDGEEHKTVYWWSEAVTLELV